MRVSVKAGNRAELTSMRDCRRDLVTEYGSRGSTLQSHESPAVSAAPICIHAPPIARFVVAFAAFQGASWPRLSCPMRRIPSCVGAPFSLPTL